MSHNRCCFPAAALDETGQGVQNLSICLEEHVMKTHRVVAIKWPDVDDRVCIVGNGKMYRFFHQAGKGIFET